MERYPATLHTTRKMTLKGDLTTGQGSIDQAIVICSVVFAASYISWLLCGLRFTNHDDIYLHLASWVFQNHYLGFALDVAQKQARIQALLNMPLVLWGTHLCGSWLYDLCTIGMFLLLHASFITYLAVLGTLRMALLISSVSIWLFPLHYYFTFPQGYPIMGPLGLTLSFFSASLLFYHLKSGVRGALYVSVVLFALSLWGPEYNIVLHPALIFMVFAVSWNKGWPEKIRKALPYIFSWGATVIIYLIYSILSRAHGGDDSGRVSISFDAFSFSSTAYRLIEKAFLPLGLIKGIVLQAEVHDKGVTAGSILLDYTFILGQIQEIPLVTVIFLLVLFALIMRVPRIDKSEALRYSIVFAAILFVPTVVVASSQHYQYIVMKGYLQGHLVTFYIQLGLSGLCFVGLALLSSLSSSKPMRRIVSFVSSLLLSAGALLAFAYNDFNRTVMLTNQQVWRAVADVALYAKQVRPELTSKTFYAPTLWVTSGVSAIPEWENVQNENYWTAYTKAVIKTPLTIVKTPDYLNFPDTIVLHYTGLVGESPITALSEKTHDSRWRITLLSSNPFEGKLVYGEEGSLPRERTLAGQWNCTSICAISFEDAHYLSSPRYLP